MRGDFVLYNNLSGYLRKKYGKRLKKICIDGGFFCPNRDGTCGTGGCIFCGERGSGEHIDPEKSIEEQVMSALENASEDDLFIAYFQNFSNTYADVETLKKRYDAALTDKRIKILSIGTRPDCIDRERAALIATYKNCFEVWVELGLQTSNEKTAKIINRGYDNSAFENAIGILKEYGIDTVVHMIIGLPEEGLEDAVNTAKYISSFKPMGIKIHSIYVMKGTKLASMYEKNLYTPPTLDEFSAACAYALSNIHDSCVIHRITGDAPKNMLIAPDWNTDKMAIIDAVRSKMTELGLKQGSLV